MFGRAQCLFTIVQPMPKLKGATMYLSRVVYKYKLHMQFAHFKKILWILG